MYPNKTEVALTDPYTCDIESVGSLSMRLFHIRRGAWAPPHVMKREGDRDLVRDHVVPVFLKNAGELMELAA